MARCLVRFQEEDHPHWLAEGAHAREILVGPARRLLAVGLGGRPRSTLRVHGGEFEGFDPKASSPRVTSTRDQLQ